MTYKIELTKEEIEHLRRTVESIVSIGVNLLSRPQEDLDGANEYLNRHLIEKSILSKLEESINETKSSDDTKY